MKHCLMAYMFFYLLCLSSSFQAMGMKSSIGRIYLDRKLGDISENIDNECRGGDIFRSISMKFLSSFKPKNQEIFFQKFSVQLYKQHQGWLKRAKTEVAQGEALNEMEALIDHIKGEFSLRNLIEKCNNLKDYNGLSDYFKLLIGEKLDAPISRILSPGMIQKKLDPFSSLPEATKEEVRDELNAFTRSSGGYDRVSYEESDSTLQVIYRISQQMSWTTLASQRSYLEKAIVAIIDSLQDTKEQPEPLSTPRREEPSTQINFPEESFEFVTFPAYKSPADLKSADLENARALQKVLKETAKKHGINLNDLLKAGNLDSIQKLIKFKKKDGDDESQLYTVPKVAKELTRKKRGGKDQQETLSSIRFRPEDVTPSNIRSFIQDLQKQGVFCSTSNSKASLLSLLKYFQNGDEEFDSVEFWTAFEEKTKNLSKKEQVLLRNARIELAKILGALKAYQDLKDLNFLTMLCARSKQICEKDDALRAAQKAKSTQMYNGLVTGLLENLEDGNSDEETEINDEQEEENPYFN